ncbi:hypothetical protein KCU92_g22, partial [Aureobasidium melanogenum]
LCAIGSIEPSTEGACLSSLPDRRGRAFDCTFFTWTNALAPSLSLLTLILRKTPLNHTYTAPPLILLASTTHSSSLRTPTH